MVFKNKSIFYTLTTLITTLAGVAVIAIIVILVTASILSHFILILALQVIFALISIYVFSLVLFRYFLSDSYLKIDHDAIELNYINSLFKTQHFNLNWDEIDTICDFVRRRRYYFVIILKNKTILNIPPELYLNSNRLNQIEQILSDKPVQIQRSTASKIYLKLADFSVFIFILVFISIIVALYKKL
jgi:hypothetical protein